jgi:hydroxyethylthiazole kinase-like sugar kinase family protein
MNIATWVVPEELLEVTATWVAATPPIVTDAVAVVVVETRKDTAATRYRSAAAVPNGNAAKV